MTTLRADIAISLIGTLRPSSPLDGGTIARLVASQSLTDGTTEDKADKLLMREPTIGASSNTEIDLQTATDTHGVAVSMDEVVAIGIEVPEDGGALEVSPGASNGWTGLLGSGSTLKLPAGSKVVLFNRLDPAWAVSGSNKTIKFAEFGGALSVVPKITIIGRSS